jgi:hypothetical protein
MSGPDRIAFRFPAHRYDENGELVQDPNTWEDEEIPRDVVPGRAFSHFQTNPDVRAEEDGTTSLRYKEDR